MNTGFLEKVKEKRAVLELGVFCVLMLAMIIVGITVLKTPVVAMCFLVIIEAVIAVMLHKVELWLHGVAVLAELVAGVLLDRIVLTVLCVIVYIAAIATLQLLDKGAEE